jgi:hypothetical protein
VQRSQREKHRERHPQQFGDNLVQPYRNPDAFCATPPSDCRPFTHGVSGHGSE